MTTRTEAITRFVDARGALIKAWPGPVAGEVYAVELLPGHPRGHHFHRHGGEWFLALAGRPVLVTENPDGSDRRIQRLDGVRVFVPPGIVHALFADEGPALVLAIADRLPDDDVTLPHRLAPPSPAETPP